MVQPYVAARVWRFASRWRWARQARKPRCTAWHTRLPKVASRWSGFLLPTPPSPTTHKSPWPIAVGSAGRCWRPMTRRRLLISSPRMMILRWLGSFIASALPAALPPPSTCHSAKNRLHCCVDHHRPPRWRSATTAAACAWCRSPMRVPSVRLAQPSSPTAARCASALPRCPPTLHASPLSPACSRRPVIRRHA